MRNTSLSLALPFALGCLVTATLVSGCSKAADRTLTLYQFQHTDTRYGQFRIDTSGLPDNAIESQSDTGGTGNPIARIVLNGAYDIDVVLRLADKE